MILLSKVLRSYFIEDIPGQVFGGQCNNEALWKLNLYHDAKILIIILSKMMLNI